MSLSLGLLTALEYVLYNLSRGVPCFMVVCGHLHVCISFMKSDVLVHMVVFELFVVSQLVLETS